MLSTGIASLSRKSLQPLACKLRFPIARHSSQSKFLNVTALSSKEGGTVQKSKIVYLTGQPPPICDVHPTSIDQGFKSEGELVFNEEKKAYFSIMLNCIVPEQNINKYYLVQLIKSEGMGYIIFTRWGRIGSPGACQQTDQPYLTFPNARLYFEEIYNKKIRKGYVPVKQIDL
eukprot:TRINITY_DN21201_c0_g1_i2.p2 TRINITY_DN21201_c0_g1~~TRINITY_DN21201_c0_g1_i2.p2  ORF type:complete len:173 (-),score=9.26 TRINITY_DN21201_c0_g1_i2:363-881(-)